MECCIRDVKVFLWLRHAGKDMLGNTTLNDAIVGICLTLVIHASSSALESLPFLLLRVFLLCSLVFLLSASQPPPLHLRHYHSRLSSSSMSETMEKICSFAATDILPLRQLPRHPSSSHRRAMSPHTLLLFPCTFLSFLPLSFHPDCIHLYPLRCHHSTVLSPRFGFGISLAGVQRFLRVR